MFRLLSFATIASLALVSIQVHAATTPDRDAQFEYHTFATCQEFESTLKQILPTTYNNTHLYEKGVSMPGMVVPQANIAPTASRADTTPRSDTNIQV